MQLHHSWAHDSSMSANRSPNPIYLYLPGLILDIYILKVGTILSTLPISSAFLETPTRMMQLEVVSLDNQLTEALDQPPNI